MPDINEEEAQARSLGLALFDASRAYENFVVPRAEGSLLRRRRLPPYRSAVIGLVGRQRRFLRAAYTLADASLVLEATGPLRSMFEFLVCQRWLEHDPDRNWKLWMKQDHEARDVWRDRLRQHAPALYDAAAESLTPQQLKEAEVISAVRTQVKAQLGNPRPDDSRSLEQRAAQVGLSSIYDFLYRYESNAATHPTLLSVDLLFEKHPKGLLLRAEPTKQFVPPGVYLHGAQLLYEALDGSGDHMPALCLAELPSLGPKLQALAEQRADRRLPNWRDLLPGGFWNRGDEP